MFWSDKYNFVISELNKLYQSIKNIQVAIGLKADPADGTVHKRLDDIESALGGESDVAPSEATIARIIVEKLTVDKDKITLKYTPVGSVVVNNRVFIKDADDSSVEDEWEDLSFNDNVITLENSDDQFDGRIAVVTYQYAEYSVITNEEYKDVNEELIVDLTEYKGSAYSMTITFTSTDGNDDDDEPDSVTIKYEDTTDDSTTEETIDDVHKIKLNEEDFIYKIFITGSCNIEYFIWYKIK